MTTYVIGDVQGCYTPLMRLLDKIKFDTQQDRLWFTGDLVNRGPDSLAVLRLLYGLRHRVVSVLGNHDLTLLAVAHHAVLFKQASHTFQDVLAAPDAVELLHWLRHCPLAYHDDAHGIFMVHAGLVPQWDVSKALALAREVEAVLQDKQQLVPFLQNLYGNEPSQWSDDLQGWERLRFIVNVLTRIRFCTTEGVLDFATKEGLQSAPPGYLPWYLIPERKYANVKILFGHWAALQGETHSPGAVALDTGCGWGHRLTAYVVEEQRIVQVDCPKT